MTYCGFRARTADLMADSFESIFRDAYEVFATSTPESLNVCTRAGCCMPRETEREMLTRPRAEITQAHLSSWLSAAFKSKPFPHKVCVYLAPCLMELAVQDDISIEYELIFERLRLGDTSLWSDAQNDVIRRYHIHYFEHFRKSTGPDPALDDVLCMFTLTRFAPRTSLKQVDAWPIEDLINRLWIDSNGTAMWQSVWWDFPDEEAAATAAHEEVLAWYNAPRLKARIDRYFETGDPQSAFYKRASAVRTVLSRKIPCGFYD